MITFQNGSGNAVVVLHEIYGINRRMEDICAHYSASGYDVYCPNLNARQAPFAYSEQEEAYRSFMEQNGFDKDSEINELLKKLSPQYRHVFLVGFSVGATLAWKCSASGLCSGAVGFYGSRIRDYLQVKPKCPVLLLFASEEKSFSPQSLAARLQSSGQAAVYILSGRHGFCDPYSGSFCPGSAAEAERISDQFIRRVSSSYGL